MLSRKFATFILTHRRPDKQHTLSLLQKSGYTGAVYLILDNEDPTEPQYRERYGDRVIVFDKRAAWAATDDADNSGSMLGVVYARNKCWDIAASLGLSHFLVLDDDYYYFGARYNAALEYRGFTIRSRIDDVFAVFLDFLDCGRFLTVAFSQGGDHIGGCKGGPRTIRKAMNAFFCRTDRPFEFFGRINEDLTASVSHGRRGGLMLTLTQMQLDQKDTQTNSGGLTELYLDVGTYVKSFYSVMWEPSCVKVSSMGDGHARIHHLVDWKRAVPCILPERYRKARHD